MEELKLMLITNDIHAAKFAEDSGVQRLFVDLESIGKEERQGHLDTHITTHVVEDVSKIKSHINKAELLVRVNPLYEDSKKEIDQVINNGADIIMLPMFTSKFDVENFIQMVNRRAKVCLLLETPQAMIRINDILSVDGIDEIHIGLNDLHLGLELDFMFEILTSGYLDFLSHSIRDKNIPFGFGGVARIGEGKLPAELIIGEHARLGSSMAILSRSFLRDRDNYLGYEDLNLSHEINKIQEAYTKAANRNINRIKEDKLKVKSIVEEIVRGIEKSV